MTTFEFIRRIKRRKGTFFPDAASKERHLWGQTKAAVDGYWYRYRFLVGKSSAILSRILNTADEYSAMRKRHPENDKIRLFEESGDLRIMGYAYYDYSGRIDTISREAIVVHLSTGERFGLQRDKGTGFRGIITRTEEPWSLDQYMWEQMWQRRITRLNRGIDFKKGADVVLTTQEPWDLRDAMEHYLRDMLNTVWMEYVASPTLEKLEEVIRTEGELYNYVLDTLRWAHYLGEWEFEYKVPFPDASAAMNLWEHDQIDDLRYDETEPWYIDDIKNKSSQVTAIRRAQLTNGRVNIQITTNPVLHCLEHPDLDIMHQMITYEPPVTGDSMVNPDVSRRYEIPFIGRSPQYVGKKVVNTGPWMGDTPLPKGWSVITGEESIVDPVLEVRTKLALISPELAGTIEAALSGDKPVLIFEGLNNANAPILILPQTYMQTSLTPLIESGRLLKPIEEHNVCSGWAINSTNRDGQCRNIFENTPSGFLETPISGRPVREGALSELLPYA